MGVKLKTISVALARAITQTPPNRPEIVNIRQKMKIDDFNEKCQHASKIL